MSFEGTNLRGWSRRAAVVFLGAAFVLFAAADGRSSERSVAIGYLPIPGPWLAAVGDGAFERETGYAIQWVRFDSDAQAIQSLHDGKIQLTYAGSTSIAVGLSGGADMELFWVAADTGFAEALVVKNESKIVAPRQLHGKRIGTQYWSTNHSNLLFVLDQFNITEEQTKIYPLTPDEIVAHWKSGGLDAAFVSYPALDKLKLDGKVLIWSEWLNSWGKATFDGFVADRRWSSAHPEFMTKFAGLVDAANADYRSNPARWTGASREVRTLARMLGGQPNVVPMLGVIRLPNLEEQLSPDWLGGGAAGTAAGSLRVTALFLERFGMIPKTLADYSRFVSPKWVQAASAEQEKRKRAGPDPFKR